MSEQQPTPPDPTAYGQPISAERQAELQAILNAWNAPDADHGERKGPFDKQHGQRLSVPLTGADVSWLAERSGRDESGRVPNLHLERANLFRAHLEGAHLRFAHLQGAHLRLAHVEGANLVEVHLQGADLRSANLKGADLRGAWLDSKTVLNTAVLDAKTRLGDIQWGGVGAVDLTRLNWGDVPRLGDETALERKDEVRAYESAVRAYRQLAAQLRAQGLAEVADRFGERAQIVQRRVLRKQLRPLQYLGAWLLGALAGYGYRPARTVFWYLVFVLGFAALYLRFGIVDGHPFRPLEALVFSLTSFHGRGFFPGGLHLDDPVTVLAAGEAVLGLLIEISFIATFTQRFFGAK